MHLLGGELPLIAIVPFSHTSSTNSRSGMEAAARLRRTCRPGGPLASAVRGKGERRRERCRTEGAEAGARVGDGS